MSSGSKPNIALLILGIIIASGAGYVFGQYPIAGLRETNLTLQSQVDQLTKANNDLIDRLEEISENLSATQLAFQTLLNNYDELSEVLASTQSELQSLVSSFEEIENQFLETKVDNTYLLGLYSSVWEKYANLIMAYNNLTSEEPVGEMVVTEITGIVNGDWESGNEGWLTQGVSNLVGGVKYLHKNELGTFTTQSVTLSGKNQGISFKIKPQPFGTDINFQVSIKGVAIFEETYQGLNSDFDWQDIIIPFRPLMQMREQYEFPIDDVYDIRFTVPAGDETGANIAIDDISLLEIEYRPEYPSDEELVGYYFDDFNTNTGIWDYQGTAYRDATNGYLVLNPAQRRARGHIWLKRPVSEPFVVNFKYKAGFGERSGADGLAFLFYQKKTIEAPDFPDQTHNVVGAMLSGRFSTSGYGVEFDNYQNGLDPSGNHIALRDQNTNHLDSVNDLRTEDFSWHAATIEVKENSVRVLIDSSEIFHWEGVLDNTNLALGFGAACGEDTNWAIIDDVSITILDQ